MNHFGKVAVAAAVMGACTSAHAADLYVKAPVGWNDIAAANNQWYLDFAGTHMDYKEFRDVFLQGPGPDILDTEKGWLPGAQTSFTVQRDWLGVHNLYFNGTFTWTHGTETHGEANPFFNGQSIHSDLKDWDFRLGKGFEIAPNVQLTPYAAAGTHWWQRTFNTVGGYAEQYHHSYAGAGLLGQWAPAPGWVLSAYGTVGGTFGSHLETQNIPGGFPIVPQTFTLGNSVIYLAGASADYAITKQWHANVGVDYVNFKYGESALNLPQGNFEPTSRTQNFTVKAGFGYSLY